MYYIIGSKNQLFDLFVLAFIECSNANCFNVNTHYYVYIKVMNSVFKKTTQCFVLIRGIYIMVMGMSTKRRTRQNGKSTNKLNDDNFAGNKTTTI